MTSKRMIPFHERRPFPVSVPPVNHELSATVEDRSDTVAAAERSYDPTAWPAGYAVGRSDEFVAGIARRAEVEADSV